MKSKKLFGNQIEPACEYCEHGEPARSSQMILCKKQGIVAPYYHCRKFLYAPLKRVPRRAMPLPQYDKKDFTLDD